MEYLFNELRMLIELIVSSGSRINIIYEHTVSYTPRSLSLSANCPLIEQPVWSILHVYKYKHNATSVHYLVIIFNQSEILYM